jgi:hypothetical protein
MEREQLEQRLELRLTVLEQYLLQNIHISNKASVQRLINRILYRWDWISHSDKQWLESVQHIVDNQIPYEE